MDELPQLPPYIYGREAGENEKVLPLEQVRLYAEQAVKQEREQACKLADALMELLRDTQHAKHPSCSDGGYCPVRDAREALDAFTNRIEGTGAAAIRARSSMESKNDLPLAPEA